MIGLAFVSTTSVDEANRAQGLFSASIVPLNKWNWEKEHASNRIVFIGMLAYGVS